MAPSPLSAPAAWLAAGALLLLVLPVAAAQAAPRPDSGAVGFAVTCEQSFVIVPYNGQGTIHCLVHDLTDDSGSPPGGVTSGGPVFATQTHTVKFTLKGTTPVNATGWRIFPTQDPVVIQGRDTRPVDFTVQVTPLVDSQRFVAVFDAMYSVPNSQGPINQTLTFAAQVAHYDFAHLETANTIQKSGQFDVVKYRLNVQNLGVYPDSYAFDVKGPSGFQISTPPPLYVPPLSQGNATVSILTPHDKLYELGQTVLFNFKASSVFGVTSYTSVGILKVEGLYVPTYWIPLTLVGLVAVAVVARGSRERAQMRRLEAGRPRRVQPTPRQRVLLADLKRTDPAAYAERKEKLDAIFLARKMRYKDEHKAQVARDQEERRQAKLEFAAGKKRRKEEKLATKRQGKLDAKAAAARRKVDEKASKAQGREMKVKEKELAKKRKVLEKARAKQAKIDAKQARVDEKAALVAAKAQAKADRQAARDAKAAAKAAKKKGDQ